MHEPWWARDRDKLFIALMVLFTASVLGLVPSPLTRGVEQLITQHSGMTEALQVLCIHQAKSADERDDCLSGIKGIHR